MEDVACQGLTRQYLPVAIITWLDHAFLHMKPKVKECHQLRDTDKLKILGIVCSGLVLLDLMGSEVRLPAQQFPETGAGRKKFGGTHQGTGQAQGHLLRPEKIILGMSRYHTKLQH